MLLKYFYDETLAQASYLVGCAETGEALVVDPARDINPYLRAAETAGLHITHVTETHIHADFVSGTRELASRTGARMYLSDMGDENWKYEFADDNTVLLHDGDMWMVGNIKVEVIHTPGHTPEHVVFQITDTKGANKPIGVFTGDFLFVGDIGRPDLLEEAAGFVGTREIGARQQFQNVERFKDMPDYLQIWPAHGSGSACGKALGAVPSTTLGYEKMFNPAFQFDEEAAFVDWLLSGQPEAPRYFAQMKKVNKVGPALCATVPTPKQHTRADLERVLDEGKLVIDTRSIGEYAMSHVPGTLNIPATSPSFSTYVGWFVDYDASVYLIMTEDNYERILRELRAIGVDEVIGYFIPEEVTEDQPALLRQMGVQELSDRLDQNGLKVIDVRGASEHAEERIPGALNVPLGYLPRHLAELPKDQPLVTHCLTGLRSQIAASLLERSGFDNVVNLSGGINAWKQAGLPIEQGE